MTTPDRLTRLFRIILRVAMVVNIAFAILFALGLAASFPFGGPLETQLIAKYGATVDAAIVIAGMRGLAVMGVVAAVAIDRILRNLLAIVDTLVDGDPFVPENARRLHVIGWSLLAMQLLDLAMGGLTWMFVTLRIEVLDWTPSVHGWLSVLIAFVLARVFASGTAMRDELGATI